MKKLISLVLLMCMVFGVCSVTLADNDPAEFYITTAREEGTFYTYNEEGKRIKVEVGAEALTVNVELVNCEENNIYSGIIELHYDNTVMRCVGAKSYTGGLWAVNTNYEDKVRLVFSTGTDVTEDGIILSAAFEYIDIPTEGEETEFTLDVPQLCTDQQGDDKYADYDIPEGEEYTYVYEEPVLYGDANGDCKVNTADAVAVLKFSAGMLELDETGIMQADVNFDETVNTGDAVVILKYCVGIITVFSE